MSAQYTAVCDSATSPLIGCLAMNKCPRFVSIEVGPSPSSGNLLEKYQLKASKG